MQTYAQLLQEVQRVAAALRGLGLVQGDRSASAMPRIFEIGRQAAEKKLHEIRELLDHRPPEGIAA